MLCSKFFTIVMIFNLIGLGLAASGRWQYPRKYTGAFVLGNLLVAILMRNELFGRCLYLLVNTLFAKVTTLCFLLSTVHLSDSLTLVDSTSLSSWLYVCVATPRRHPFWMCHIGDFVVDLPHYIDLHQPPTNAQLGAHYGCHHKFSRCHIHCLRIPMGQKYSS